MGYKDMQPTMLMALDDARDTAQVPFVLNSAVRCPAHNLKEGGRDNSAHLRGWAVDILCPSKRARYRILKGLFAHGFHRIGIYNGFIHADMDPSLPPEVTWLK